MTNQTDSAAGYLRYPHYAESHSARSWFVVFIGLLAPIAALVVLIVTVNTKQNALLALFFALMLLWLLSIGTRANWGVGIKIDDTGITIGGWKRESRWWWRAWERVRFVHGPATTRPTTYTVSMPWDGVRSVRVVTDRGEMKRVIRDAPRQAAGSAVNNSLRYFWQVGAMVPFYALIWYHWSVGGFLVFDVDPHHARVPEFRLPSRRLAMPPSSTWICPTRRPEQLRRAIEQLQPLLNR